ncbi:hypothetical protein CXB51_018003 [Gossypium anomalum]|uniref:Reverse transcriptase Ty1/copia-type domain-containing protein n=1 Tax=Gossypium anomalum TaxID=47600 RepID=A0A8J5YVQ4_9ROSI|nr:hypothetical protein CXB51_018003 [Gossypium anomalum]
MKNNTWSLVSLPADRTPIGCKWLFKVKRKPDGSVKRYKAKLVGKGYSQKAGFDYQDTLSLVVKPVTIQFILSIAVTKRWKLRQVDINMPFLMAPRTWFDKLKFDLVSEGFDATKSDALFFVRIRDQSVIYILVYVDDIIITGNNDDKIDLVKYILELLAKYHMAEAHGVPTPMASSCVLSASCGSPLGDESAYGSIAGASQYAMISWPEIAYVVNKLCQFMHKPLDTHFKAMKIVLRYLAATSHYGLCFQPAKRMVLTGFSDANWGLDIDDRRSTSGYCIYFGGSTVSWSSKKQQVVSRSNAEAEYHSLAHAAAEISSAVAVSANPIIHSKFKHMEFDLFFVRERVAQGKLIVGQVPAQDQVVDTLTKPSSEPFFKLRVCAVLRS